jgi:hypothetical protein
LSVAGFMWSFVFGIVGFALFVYGKNRQEYLFLFSGAALYIAPHLVKNVYELVAVGVVIVLIPFFIKI